MDRLLSYLSFQGRTNRKLYWRTNLAVFGLIICGVLVVGVLSAVLRVLGILAIPLFLFIILVSLANSARRLHDRNKSAWWLLVFSGVPFVLSAFAAMMRLGGGAADQGGAALVNLIGFGFSMWAFAELGFLKGTAGPNQFGDDPLGAGVQEVFA